MSQILHRGAQAPKATINHGEGPYLYDTKGKSYLDACCGAAVSCLGHNHPVITQAIKAQLDKVAYAHTSFFTSETSENLADRLIDMAPSNMSQVYMVSGGSEANEAALKLARQYFVEIGQPQRKHFIARRQSYHGNTTMTLAIGGNEMRKEMFKPILPDSHHVAPCFAYREQAQDETEEQYSLRTANELERKILELGEDKVIAFIVEPIVGATAGAVPPTAGYFKRIREICDHYGVLLILDEIMCGMGRTGTHFAIEQEQVQADIITIAKGLGGGYQPIGATLISKGISEAIKVGTGFFQHGHTYICHPTVSAAALAVQNEISEQRWLDNVSAQSNYLQTSLHAAFDTHPHIGDIRGRGLFLGIEFVKDKTTKQPFSPDSKLHFKLKQCAMEAGLLIYPMPGTIDGRHGHHILLAPPFIINEAHCDEIVAKLQVTFTHALEGLV